jgi:hypothetical protein
MARQDIAIFRKRQVIRSLCLRIQAVVHQRVGMEYQRPVVVLRGWYRRRAAPS